MATDINQSSIAVDINGSPSGVFNYATHCTSSDGNYVCSYTETAFNTNVDYNLTVYGCDLAGNCDQNTSIFSYTGGNYAPQVIVLNPNGSQYVGGTYSIDFNVLDLDNDELHSQLWYSTSALNYTNSIVADLNLIAVGIIDFDPFETTSF